MRLHRFEQMRSGARLTSRHETIAATVATSVDDVIEAWRLVYRTYRRSSLIPENRWRLHTVLQAVHSDSAVILGRVCSRLVNTMTIHFDGPNGLSLDSLYKRELDALRGRDRKLAEVGLFADRRIFGVRSVKPLLQIMRLAWYYSVTNGVTDGIIGVHPRHACFYARWLGFKTIGPERHYRLVNSPTVLLHVDWRKALQRSPMPRGYPTILSRPLQPGYFNDRIRLTKSVIFGTPIQDMLRDQLLRATQ